MRVIAATNRDLATMVREKTFREDLFYLRLNVFPLTLPPLRGAEATCRCWSTSSWAASPPRRPPHRRRVAGDGMDLLQAYPWPGNIRELGNVLERAIILNEGPTLAIGPEVLSLPPVATIKAPAAAGRRASSKPSNAITSSPSSRVPAG